MQIINQNFPFGPFSGSGPQVSQATVTFPAPITQAAAILTGFTAEYSGGNDHHLGRLEIQVDVLSISGANVVIKAQFGLRDWSGNWDDQYDGQIFVSVIGE
jgi:hypothetical protein